MPYAIFLCNRMWRYDFMSLLLLIHHTGGILLFIQNQKEVINQTIFHYTMNSFNNSNNIIYYSIFTNDF